MQHPIQRKLSSSGLRVLLKGGSLSVLTPSLSHMLPLHYWAIILQEEMSSSSNNNNGDLSLSSSLISMNTHTCIKSPCVTAPVCSWKHQSLFNPHLPCSEFPLSVKRPPPGAVLMPRFCLRCTLTGESSLKWGLLFFSIQNDRVSAVGTKPHCPLTLSPVE